VIMAIGFILSHWVFAVRS